MADAYVPTTEAGKKMLAEGGDLSVVEQMEKSGELTDSTGEEPQHVDTSESGKKEDGEEETPEEIEARTAKEADDLVAKLKELGVEAEASEGLEALQAKLTEAGEGEEPVNRTPRTVPVWKHKEEMKKQREALEEQHKNDLAAAVAAAAGKKDGATDADVDAIAEEFGIKPEVATKLIDRMAQVLETRSGLPQIRETVAKAAEREKVQQEEQGFENEWASKDTTDALAAAAGDRQITKEVKDKIKELAYTTTYAKYRLPDIIRLEAGKLFTEAPKAKQTAEPSRGGTARGAAPKSVLEMSPEELSSMSDEEFMKASDELGKKGSKFVRTTLPKKK